MKNLLVIIINIFFCFKSFSQTILNSAGDTFKSSNYKIIFSVGEMVSISNFKNSQNINTGILQANNNLVTSILNDNINDDSIQVYPTLTKDIIKIQFPTSLSAKIKYTLIDMMGNKLQSGIFSTNSINIINLIQYIPGLYNLIIASSLRNDLYLKIHTYKIIKL